MKKLLTSTVLAAVFAVALAPAAFAEGFTVVNDVCSDAGSKTPCYASLTETLQFEGAKTVANRPVAHVIAANPGIEQYLVKGKLPARHVFALEPSS